jgi:hypothetical protein
MNSTFSARADDSFVVVPAAASAGEAMAALGDAHFAIVAGDDAGPLALGTGTEMARLAPGIRLSDALDQLSPAVVIPAAAEAETVFGSNAVTLLELNPHGAVVSDGRQIVGIVPTAALDELIATAAYGIESRRMGEAGDGLLAGAALLPRARVCCAAVGCGYRNELAFYDPDRPPACGNPDRPGHPLIVGGR